MTFLFVPKTHAEQQKLSSVLLPGEGGTILILCTVKSKS